MIIHVFRRLGLHDLITSLERGETTARSSDVNHLAEVVTNAVKLTRGMDVVFDFAAFSTVALGFIGTSCFVSDVIERLPGTLSVPANDLLAFATDADERSLINDLMRREGIMRVIPTLSASSASVAADE